MGTTFVTETIRETDKKKVQVLWDQAVARSKRSDGDEYSGGIGMLGDGIKWSPAIAVSEVAAEDLISKQHEKWSSAIAVAFRESKPSPEAVKAVADLAHEAGRAFARATATRTKIHEEMRAGPREFVTCKGGCESRLKRAHLPSLRCPLCQRALTSKAQAARIEKDDGIEKDLRAKALAAREALETGPADGPVVGYVIGGWCAE